MRKNAKNQKQKKERNVFVKRMSCYNGKLKQSEEFLCN